jgi:hypothetical protein
MPILDIMQKQPTGTGLPRIAKIHKGSPKVERTNGKGDKYLSVGTDLPYFRVEFNPGYEYLSAEFAQKYGAEPTELPFKFNADHPLQAMDAWYEEWNSSGTMLHRCDGVNQAVTFNTSTGHFDHNQYACAMPSCKCKKTARLELIMMDFMESTGVLGTITFETHADTDIRTLYAHLSGYYALFGTLRNIPFILTRAPREISAPKMNGAQRTGERMKITKSLVDVIADPEYVQNHLASLRASLPQRSAPRIAAQETPALSAPTEAPQLPAESASLSSLDEVKWPLFLKWAEDKFNRTPMDVKYALRPAARNDVFEGSRTLAMACVLADAANYKADEIKAMGKEKRLPPEVISEAMLVPAPEIPF